MPGGGKFFRVLSLERPTILGPAPARAWPYSFFQSVALSTCASSSCTRSPVPCHFNDSSSPRCPYNSYTFSPHILAPTLSPDPSTSTSTNSATPSTGASTTTNTNAASNNRPTPSPVPGPTPNSQLLPTEAPARGLAVALTHYSPTPSLFTLFTPLLPPLTSLPPHTQTNKPTTQPPDRPTDRPTNRPTTQPPTHTHPHTHTHTPTPLPSLPLLSLPPSPLLRPPSSLLPPPSSPLLHPHTQLCNNSLAEWTSPKIGWRQRV